MEKTFECVPNFSEGKDNSTINALKEAIQQTSGIKIANIHADRDHNRSVFTLIGSGTALFSSMMHVTPVAMRRIDLNHQTGAHPRIGAIDVIPFVPLQNATMDDACELAKTLGKTIAEQFSIPIFLYGNAAQTLEHQKLSAIRKGGYEFLAKNIGNAIRSTPDFGPCTLSPAGAFCVGARDYLIAFNIFLNTDEVSIAKQIAQTIRESNGGLPAVQALGMRVNGKAQVSMNLTNFRQTSIQTVFNEVQQLAKQAGTQVDTSELVGCVPKAALENVKINSLKLIEFSPERILENYL